FAVEHLLDHALEPALDAHLERLAALMDAGDEAGAGNAFFDFRCADIAMGSAHFLVAAVDRIEARLSSFLVERPVPAVTAELERLRKAALDHLGDLGDSTEIDPSSLLRRQVARRCIYGVDRNLIAVELARLGIWIHTFVPGLPLSFLDRTLVWGDSLTGVGTLDEAVEQLDPGAGSEASGQSLYRPLVEALIERTAAPLARLGRVSDADAAEVAAAREALDQAHVEAQPARDLLDLIVAIRLGEAVAIEDLGESVIANHPDLGAAHELAEELGCLHFPLAFPEVFLRDRPGFDCILGNPPWEELTVEEPAFWALRFPGLRSLAQRQQRPRIQELRRRHPDLVEELEQEQEEAAEIRQLLVNGPYPGMETGDPDLYKAFAWRFWHLVREDGAIGVVLPRSALAAAGSARWRETVLDAGAFADTTLLLNNRKWVFEEVHAQYTVALASLRKGANHAGRVRVRGPYRDRSTMQREVGSDESAEFPVDEFRTWATGAAFPLLPSTRSGEVFLKLRAHPRFDDSVHPWQARPVREVDATNEKSHMILDPDDVDGLWPVYKGASFEIWEPDTGTYYAWADPEYITEYLQGKRERGSRTKSSAFSEMKREWIDDPATLPCRHPRVAFRDVARATDTRTVIAALVPSNVVIANQAPYLLWSKGGASDEAFILGILASVPLDWCARRIVETHVNFHVLNGFPIPDPCDEGRNHVVGIAGRLACPDDRFAGWAEAVGVDADPVEPEQKDDLIAELDAAVARLYGLDRDDVKHILETFHEGWDYAERLERVLAHFDDLEGLR
ncbi:MAG: hypothetical protein KJ006_00300, partial [Thermoleophilia bacterium]|nr:hypothetical protein [Thermoleophilia bacterium]